MIPFYDDTPLEPRDDGWVDIERIYCFDWNQFDESLLNRLRSIFATLPGSIKDDADGCHWWYSDRSDEDNGYLTAGVEPPGLQVFGTLKINTWQEWDRLFQARSEGLPTRDLR